MVSCARSHAAKLDIRAQMGSAVSHASVWPTLGKCVHLVSVCRRRCRATADRRDAPPSEAGWAR
eukprot:588084-Prymnesium_polylepis.1